MREYIRTETARKKLEQLAEKISLKGANGRTLNMDAKTRAVFAKRFIESVAAEDDKLDQK